MSNDSKNIVQRYMADANVSPIMPVILPSFHLSSTRYFDADSFTSLVNIQPTSSWVQQKPHLVDLKGLTQASWEYRFRPIHAQCIERATNQILVLFYPLRSIIKPYIRQNKMRTCVYLRVYITDNGLHLLTKLTQKTMRRICELGASFQIDTYPIDKIELIEKFVPIKYKTNKNGDTRWVLQRMK